MSKSRFRDRMLIYFLTIILLPVLTLGLLGPLLYAKEVSNQSAAHTRELVERITANLDLTIKDKEKLLTMLLQYPGTREFYKVGFPKGISSSMENLFSSATEAHPEITGLIAVSQDNRMYSGELDRILRDPLVDEEWYLSAIKSDTDFSLITRPTGRNLKNSLGTEPDEIVSMIKSVNFSESGENAGVLMADLSLAFLEEILQESLTEEPDENTGFFCIFDNQGNVVYAPVNPIVYRINPDWFTDSSRIIEKTIRNRGYQFIFTESSYTGWKTVGVYYLEDALRPVRFVQFSALIIALITIVLSVLVSMVYTNAVSKPVLYLLSVMEKAGHGDLSVRYDGQSRDEIDELGAGLNAMLERVGGLLALVYKEQQSKREAELRIMQQQIKPHFLYNTLDTILWMAEENEPLQIVEVVTALTKLFRIALSQGQEIISLDDEIDHVRSYLIIQKNRYEDKFDFEIIFPEDMSSLQVQKLILQPIVENAIYHGVKEMKGSGQITVTAAIEENQVLLTVRDDGAGIPPDILLRINKGLKHMNHETDRAAFALYNVNDRIRLTYGDDYGIAVSSDHGKGTVVTIRHPVILSTD